MAEKRLLVGPDPDGSTFEKAFGKAARLPTQEDKDAALEQSVADMRKELYRPEYQSDAQRDTRMASWQRQRLAKRNPNLNT